MIRWLQLVASPAWSKSEPAHVGGTSQTCSDVWPKRAEEQCDSSADIDGSIGVTRRDRYRARVRRNRECTPFQHRSIGCLQRHRFMDRKLVGDRRLGHEHRHPGDQDDRHRRPPRCRTAVFNNANNYQFSGTLPGRQVPAASSSVEAVCSMGQRNSVEHRQLGHDHQAQQLRRPARRRARPSRVSTRLRRPRRWQDRSDPDQQRWALCFARRYSRCTTRDQTSHIHQLHGGHRREHRW